MIEGDIEMDLGKELQRISKIIDDMPMKEFEGILFDCGLGVIKQSEECFNEESIKERNN